LHYLQSIQFQPKATQAMNTGRTSLLCFLLFFVGLFAAMPLL